MRFKKGDKVEVMDNEEVPISWRTAEILSCSRNTYTVQYEYCPGMMSDQVRKTVLTNSVRPCPQILQGVESFSAGDTVEIFYEYSWKVAAILKILGGVKGNKRNKTYQQDATLRSRYLVRLLGCSQQLIIDGSNIRRRQTWHDGTWILMGKNFRAAADVTKVPTSSCYQKMNVLRLRSNSRANTQAKDFAYTYGDDALQETTEMSLRSQKRMSPFASSIVDLHCQHFKRLRAIETEGLKQKANAAPVLPAKVYGVAYPGEILAEKNMHASVNIISNRYNQMEKNHVIGYSGVRNSELSSDDNDTCSVGSCSVTSGGFNCSYRQPMHMQCPTGTLCSDAESFCGSESDTESSSLPRKEDLEMMPGFVAFLMALNSGRFSRLLSDRCYSLWLIPGITIVVAIIFLIPIYRTLNCVLNSGVRCYDQNAGVRCYDHALTQLGRSDSANTPVQGSRSSRILNQLQMNKQCHQQAEFDYTLLNCTYSAMQIIW